MKEKIFEILYKQIIRGYLTVEEAFYMMKLLFENNNSNSNYLPSVITKTEPYDWGGVYLTSCTNDCVTTTRTGDCASSVTASKDNISYSATAEASKLTIKDE